MTTFESLGLSNPTLKAVEALGFTQPSEIQEKAIPNLLGDSCDVIGLAQTGTGKTAAFGLPMVDLVDFSSKFTQGLVVCPTRELCNQITRDILSYAKNADRPNIVPVYGGASIETQIKAIKRGAQIVVATPGRLVDLIRRKAIKLETIKYLVLDEADEMLNMGFKEDLDTILEQTPSSKKVWLFSATMPKEVRRIASNYMKDPVEITVGEKNSTAKNITHQYFIVKERDRYEAVKRLLDYYPEIFGLIFCRTKRETGQVSEKLEKEGYNVVPLHGDLSQAQRDAAMKKFREKTVQVLVATDVAARGIDVKDVTHVIHYNLPDDVENYTHRSGRTARAGKSGMSMSLINTREGGKIKQIERIIGDTIELSKIPGPKEICEKQMYALIDRVVATEVNESEMDQYWDVIYDKFKELTAEEVVMKFISAEFNKFIEYYKKSGNLNAEKGADRDSGRGRDKRDDSDKDRFFISLGEHQNLNKGALVRLLCNESGINSSAIGRIEIHPGFSFFEVDKDVATKIIPALKNKEYEGTDFSVELSKEKGGGSRSRGGGGKRYSRGGGGNSYGGSGGGGGRRTGGRKRKNY